MKPRKRRTRKKPAVIGGEFEADIVMSAGRDDWKLLRIPNGCRWVGKAKVVPVKSPFDYAAAKIFDSQTERYLYFDAKTTDENRFPVGKIKEDQVEQLKKFSYFRTAMAGYVVNFEKHGTVVFFTVDQLARALTARKSLAHTVGIVIGNRWSMKFEHIFQGRAIHALGQL